MALKLYNKYLEDITANQINFGCSRKNGVPYITDTYLQFTKEKFDRLVLKEIAQKIIFIVLTAVSCPLKFLDRFT